MPTNEERREVAKELRYTASHSLNGYGFQKAVEWMTFGTLRDRTWREILERLADLIEPEERTCTLKKARWDDGSCTWGVICSVCGHKHEHQLEGVWNYCPACGARMVE